MANSGAGDAIMDIDNLADAFEWQARHAEEGGAPGTAKIVRGILAALETDTAMARRISSWEGLSVRDALPLRITGGLHNLVLTGSDTRLEKVYSGLMTEQNAIDALVSELFETFDTRLLPWLDGPPQTNEAGRSASIMGALKWLAAQGLPAQFALYEIGSSAGVNTMMERYRYYLGGVEQGPESSPLRIAPDWRGSSPPDAPLEIMSVKGCDQAPIDITDPEAALRLKSYVWPEASERMHRIDAAVQLANERAPDIAHQDAGDFVSEMIAERARKGITRVLFHSIVWQYLPDSTQDGITRAMEKAGAAASPDAPLAWIALETNRETFRHECRVRYWPGGEVEALLGHAHPHGAWVNWGDDA